MANHPSTPTADRTSRSRTLPWGWFEPRSASAFVLAGVWLVASMLAPIGLRLVTDQAWVAGLVLVGTAVLAVAAGLAGLYSEYEDRTSTWAIVGLLGGVLAGVAALGLIAMVGAALLGETVLGVELGKPKTAFMLLSVAMAGGYGLGFLSFGIAGWRDEVIPRVTSRLLLSGGVVLLVPLVGELTRQGIGIGSPPWLFLPAIVLIALDTLAVGYSLGGRRD